MLFKRNHSPNRRSRRQWINTSVQVFAGSAQLNALGINLSDGGMGLFAVANLPVGSEIQIEFILPKTKTPVRTAAMVRHRALYLYGIEFLSTEAGQVESESCIAQQV